MDINNKANKEQLPAETNAGAADLQIKQLQERIQALELMNREKSKLLSIVSHDLKSPLDSIKNYFELLAGNMLTLEERTDVEGQLMEQTKYTSELLTNLLSWAKTQMDGVTVNLAPIQLKEIVNLIAGNKLSLVARKGIKLTYSISPAIEVIGDVDMLKIALRNLLNNAIKFTKTGGEIVIKAERIGNEIKISISDTGIGIAADKQGEIFSSKIHPTYGTNNEKGIGLGLTMCKEFMNYQKGTIGFESTEGAGSTFYITLPRTRR